MVILNSSTSIDELRPLASHFFGDMVKAVADVDRNLLALDAELHSDLEALLLSEGSKQEHLWGFNLYPELPLSDPDFIEYDSLINIRPWQGNRGRDIEDPQVRGKIEHIIKTLIV